MADQGSDEKRVHEKFNANDSDVTIESADGVLFQLHTQNLKITTGAFPGSEFSTKGDTTKLTEDAEVLEIVFAYIYPQRHPNLEGISFFLLAKVAEAVEKYEVFPAMNISSMRMREYLPEHAAVILAHGTKHGYPKLINEAALSLCRSGLSSRFAHNFSPATVLAWIKYSESWKAIFQSSIENLQSIYRFHDYCRKNRPEELCDTCRVALLEYIMKLEKINSLPDLKDALGPLAHHKFPASDLVYCSNLCAGTQKCIHMEKVVTMIEDGIAKIPPFEEFLAEFQ